MSIVNDLAAELGIDPSTLYDHLLGAGEALQPTYLTTTPAGAIGADFSGKVHAQGLVLNAAASGLPVDTDSIEWIDPLSAYIAALLTAQYQSGSSAAALIALRPGGVATTSALRLQAGHGASPSTGTVDVDIELTADDRGGANSYVTVNIQGQQIRLYDGAGQSSFLQQALYGARKIDFGNTTLTWGGASPVATATVNHALGVTPVAVLALCAGTSSGFATAAYAPSLPTTTRLSLGATALGGTPPNGSTAALWWLVIG